MGKRELGIKNWELGMLKFLNDEYSTAAVAKVLEATEQKVRYL